MEYTKLMSQKILSKFLCPFTCDSNGPRKNCPFWHPAQEEEESHWHHEHAECTYECPPNIKPLPPYCCASFLALKCSKREYSFQCGAHSSAEILTRCEDGFHMELSEVDNLQLFAQKMAKVLLETSEFRRTDFKAIDNSDHGYCRNPVEVLNPLPSNYISAGNKRPRHVLFKDDENEDENDNSCAICLDPLKTHQIGHLDNCSHVFCAKCIHKWQNQGVNEGCPVCRKRITKILVWPKLLQTQEEKKQLFDLISGGVPSDDRVDRAMSYGTPTTLTTSKGKTMRALQMNPEGMKVFLKKPKPNWNCYVMTELAVERSERVPSVGSETTAARNNNENNEARIRSIIEAHMLRQQPSNISAFVMDSLHRARASNAGSNNAATNQFATINAETNNAATNNATTNTPRICNNVAALLNTRLNNLETNRSNNGEAISNVAPNIVSTTNFAATNSANSTASNNAAPNNVVTRTFRIGSNVAALLNAPFNNLETNRSNNNGPAISNVLPNIASASNLTAATNPNPTNSTVSSNFVTNPTTNNNQTSESNISRVPNPNHNPVRSASNTIRVELTRHSSGTFRGRLPVDEILNAVNAHRRLNNVPITSNATPNTNNASNNLNTTNPTVTNNVSSNIAPTNPTTTTNNVSANAASNIRSSGRNTSQLHNPNQIPILPITQSESSEIMRMLSRTLRPNNPVNLSSNVSSTNPNPTNSTVANNGPPNSNNVRTISRSVSPDRFIRTSNGRIATLDDLNLLFANNERACIQHDIARSENANNNTSDNVAASANNVSTNNPS